MGQEKHSPQPTTIGEHVRNIAAAGGFMHCQHRALEVAANMDFASWNTLLGALKEAGLKELAKNLEDNWTKIGTNTVPTIAATVHNVKGTSNLLHMIDRALRAAALYDQTMWHMLLSALRQDPVTKYAAESLEKERTKVGQRTVLSVQAAVREAMKTGNLRLQRDHAIQASAGYSAEMREQFLCLLQKNGAQHLAKELRETYRRLFEGTKT